MVFEDHKLSTQHVGEREVGEERRGEEMEESICKVIQRISKKRASRRTPYII